MLPSGHNDTSCYPYGAKRWFPVPERTAPVIPSEAKNPPFQAKRGICFSLARQDNALMLKTDSSGLRPSE